jgi:hypothetical protein
VFISLGLEKGFPSGKIRKKMPNQLNDIDIMSKTAP